MYFTVTNIHNFVILIEVVYAVFFFSHTHFEHHIIVTGKDINYYNTLNSYN